MNPNHLRASDVKIRSVGSKYELFYSPSELPAVDGPIYFRTDNPGGYSVVGKEGRYLLGSVEQRKSNLNIVTVSLTGENGVQCCHDVLDSNEAIRMMSKMKAASAVDYDAIGSIYVGE